MENNAMPEVEEITELQEKLTLPVLLEMFEKIDSGRATIGKDLLTLLFQKMGAKIDGYKAILDRCDSEIEHNTKRAKPFLDNVARLKNKQIKIENMLKYFMVSNKSQSLFGDVWQVDIKKTVASSTESVNNTPASSTLYLNLGDFIRRGYAWDKTKIKQNLKSKTPNKDLAKLFVLTDTIKPKFKLKSEVKS